MIGAAEPPAFALEAREPVIAVGLPVSDTCKEVVAGLVRRTVPRETLVDLKGPWLITRESFGSALGRLGADAPVEDPLQLCRAAGLSIHVMVRT